MTSGGNTGINRSNVARNRDTSATKVRTLIIVLAPTGRMVADRPG